MCDEKYFHSLNHMAGKGLVALLSVATEEQTEEYTDVASVFLSSCSSA